MRRFPPVYHFDDPDTSLDARYPWVFPHHYYVYTMACLLIFNPIRHYMVRSYTRRSPPEELSIRAVGVSYSLKLMRTLRSWVDGIYDRDGRLHFIFSIFDTAAILCTAIKDYEHTITEHDAIMDVISDAVTMLERLNSISKVARTSYDLERLVRRLPTPVTPHRQHQPHKKASLWRAGAGARRCHGAGAWAGACTYVRGRQHGCSGVVGNGLQQAPRRSARASTGSAWWTCTYRRLIEDPGSFGQLRE